MVCGVQHNGDSRMETSTVLDIKCGYRETGPDFAAWTRIAIMAALVIGLYGWVFMDMAGDWWSDDSASYGMLVPPIALYIAFARRRVTLALPARPDHRGLWLLALACLIFLLGKLASEFFLARISSVFLLAGLIWTFWGFPRFKTLLFPLVLLSTMVPLPVLVYNSLAAPLQLFASGISTTAAQALGVSIYRDGNIIHLANTTLGVAEACSGLHSLSAMVVASLLLGYVEGASVLGRILLFILSVPLAIAVNVVRVTGTAVLADYRAQFAMGFYHVFSGWLVFVMGFAVLWLLGKGISAWTRSK